MPLSFKNDLEQAEFKPWYISYEDAKSDYL